MVRLEESLGGFTHAKHSMLASDALAAFPSTCNVSCEGELSTLQPYRPGAPPGAIPLAKQAHNAPLSAAGLPAGAPPACRLPARGFQ